MKKKKNCPNERCSHRYLRESQPLVQPLIETQIETYRSGESQPATTQVVAHWNQSRSEGASQIRQRDFRLRKRNLPRSGTRLRIFALGVEYHFRTVDEFPRRNDIPKDTGDKIRRDYLLQRPGIIYDFIPRNLPVLRHVNYLYSYWNYYQLKIFLFGLRKNQNGDKKKQIGLYKYDL